MLMPSHESVSTHHSRNTRRSELAESPQLPQEDDGSFAVNLSVFSGPFHVLLSLISRKKLDITDVSLAEVTDEFLAFVAQQSEQDLSQVSEFLVVAATLLDLKAARLLPHEEPEEEDKELLEARDLLFAKLLQYRAYQRMATYISQRLMTQELYVGRDVPLEEDFRGILPKVELTITPEHLAMMAAQAVSRKEPSIELEHLHIPKVTVESQIDVIRRIIADSEQVSFAELCKNAHDLPTVVSRFLAVLELMREGEIRIQQNAALEPMVITRIRDKKLDVPIRSE